MADNQEEETFEQEDLIEQNLGEQNLGEQDLKFEQRSVKQFIPFRSSIDRREHGREPGAFIHQCHIFIKHTIGTQNPSNDNTLSVKYSRPRIRKEHIRRGRHVNDRFIPYGMCSGCTAKFMKLPYHANSYHPVYKRFTNYRYWLTYDINGTIYVHININGYPVIIKSESNLDSPKLYIFVSDKWYLFSKEHDLRGHDLGEWDYGMYTMIKGEPELSYHDNLGYPNGSVLPLLPKAMRYELIHYLRKFDFLQRENKEKDFVVLDLTNQNEVEAFNQKYQKRFGAYRMDPKISLKNKTSQHKGIAKCYPQLPSVSFL